AGAVAFVGLVALALLSPAPWASRLGPTLLAQLLGHSPTNMLLSTEDLADAKRWNHLGVTVTRVPGEGEAVWRVERVEEGVWTRPQQTVTVVEGRVYTLSGEFRAEPGRQPGFIAWRGKEDIRLDLSVGLAEGAEALVRARGGVASAEAEVSEADDGWRRLSVTFVPTASGPIAVGPAPDLEGDEFGAAVQVRRLQLEEGATASAYRPTTYLATGLGEATARLPIFQ